MFILISRVHTDTSRTIVKMEICEELFALAWTGSIHAAKRIIMSQAGNAAVCAEIDVQSRARSFRALFSIGYIYTGRNAGLTREPGRNCRGVGQRALWRYPGNDRCSLLGKLAGATLA
jgi:hypothetical protein